MKVYPFKATFPHMDMIPSPDLFFSSIKSQYVHHRTAGFYEKDDEKAIYIQQITTKHGVHQGIIVNNELEDLKSGKILKHEKTLNAKEQTMMNFFLKSRAMVKPVLLAHPEVQGLTDIINEIIKKDSPVQKAKFDDGQMHKYWKITDSDTIIRIQKIFEQKVKKCYIADGHHRCATVLKMSENVHINEEGINVKRILSAYYSFDNLKIFDYNRIVNIQGEISPLKTLAQLSKYAKIKPLETLSKPKQQHHVHLLLGGECFRVKWKSSLIKKHQNEQLVLDAMLVNKYLFNDILKIKDVRTDPRISYSEGIKDFSKVVKPLRKEKYKIGVFLPPLTMSEIVTAAENQIALPPKSTWFEPRIKSGLLVREF